MITAKVIRVGDNIRATIVPSTPAIVPTVTREQPDGPVVPYLNEKTMVPTPSAVLNMLDVGVESLVSGAILFWDDSVDKFMIQKYDPNEIDNSSVDGGTF